MSRKKKSQEMFAESRRKREENEQRILAIIKEGEYSNAEIKSRVGLSKPTVSRHLKRMEYEKLIETKVADDDKQGKKVVYILTEKGVGVFNFDDIKVHKWHLDNIEKKYKGRVFPQYSELGIVLDICSLPWGIEPYLVVNKKVKELELLSKTDAEEIELLLFEKIKKNIKYIQEHELKFKKKNLELLSDSKLIFGFKIDLAKIHESIKKNSLEKYDNMSTEQVESYFEKELMKMDDDYD